MTMLPRSVQLKLDLLFEGIRYTEALGAAADGALPNYYPYRFADGEPDPTGTGQAAIPFMLTLEDDTHIRIKGNPESSYHVERDAAGRSRLEHDGASESWPIDFEPLPSWMSLRCSDGTPMSRTGVSIHGDMLVVNPAPGCQYWPARQRFGRRMRCAFCLYGQPADHHAALGQDIDDPLLPDWALLRIRETVAAALATGTIRHVYLVAGSMIDWEDEARRFLQVARSLREGCAGLPYVACGSGALPHHALRTLHDESLVDGVCFNLEVFGEELFDRICPGKAQSVGYGPWIRSLERAVDLWGPGNVYTAMVAGVELEARYAGLPVSEASRRALAGAAEMLERGILPIFSLYWPLYGRASVELLNSLREYFSTIHLGYAELRRSRQVAFNDAFMCHRCSYMQLECDLDRADGLAISHRVS
jgi:hypothetical protein